MFKFIPAIFLLLVVIKANSQSFHFDRKVILNYEVHNASIDREGNLYLTSVNGDIHKYKPNGDSLLSYSSGKNTEISLIEAWNGLKIFVFYQDAQEYIFLDRFLRASPVYTFNPQLISYAAMATLAGDENLWVFDQGDFSLKKYNPRSNDLEIKTPLGLLLPGNNYNISYMKEYQNRLYIIDANTGIHIINNMGNYEKKLPFTGMDRIGIHNHLMYFIKEKRIHITGITNSTEKFLDIPYDTDITPEIVIPGPQKIYLIQKNQLIIYRLKI